MNNDRWWEEITDKNQIVEIFWYNENVPWWNEQCAKVLEVFGLPGHRFYYKPGMYHMSFTFKTTKDANLCRILLSESL